MGFSGLLNVIYLHDCFGKAHRKNMRKLLQNIQKPLYRMDIKCKYIQSSLDGITLRIMIKISFPSPIEKTSKSDKILSQENLLELLRLSNDVGVFLTKN